MTSDWHIPIDVDMGSDDRAVKACINCDPRCQPAGKTHTSSKVFVKNGNCYQVKLAETLSGNTISASNVDDRLPQVEQSTLAAAEQSGACCSLNRSLEPCTVNACLRTLIFHRRCLHSADVPARKHMCKETQKLRRKKLRQREVGQNSKIFSEFKGLHAIASVKSASRRGFSSGH